MNRAMNQRLRFIQVRPPIAIALLSLLVSGGGPIFAGDTAKRVDPAKPTDRADWWSFKPIARPGVPRVAGDIRNPIDAFVRARLQSEGLSPSKEADRRTLIRRVTFDLIGLPPTPEEIDTFVSDPAPDAYERLVDRLLASPRYGERWARHWLDVVHYGDTHGFDKDKIRPNAWPYRDYVIRAFNEDKPYARFVREQLAGDRLYPGDPDGVVATGFIVAGPWDAVGQIEVSENTSNGAIVRNLDRDDMVMNTMSTFTSLTVHCARCHNHKFDPITQLDYYSLQAVFAGIGRADRPCDSDPAVALRRAQLTQEKGRLETALAALEQKVKSITPPTSTALDHEIETLRRRAAALAPSGAALANRTLGYHSAIEKKADLDKWVQVDLGTPRPIDAVFLVPVWHDYSGWPGPGWGFPHRFKLEASDDPNFASGVTLLADHTKADFPSPGTMPVASAAPPGLKTRYIRMTATRLWERTDDFIFALSEMIVLSQGRDAALGAAVTSLDSIEAPGSWGKAYLVDGMFGRTSFAQIADSAADPSATNGYHSEIAATPDTTKWVQIDLGKPQPIDRIRLIPARPTDFPDTPGFGFPVRFKVEAANDSDFSRATILVDQTDADFASPGDNPVAISGRGALARFVRVTANRLWERTHDYVFALAELEVESGGQIISRGAAVSALDSIESGRWSRAALVDGYNSRTRISVTNTPRSGIDGFAEAQRAGQQLQIALGRRDELLRQSIPTELSDQMAQARSSLDSVKVELARLAAPREVYAAASHFTPVGNHVPPPGGKPRPIHVLFRGNIGDPRELVGAGAVAFVPGANARFQLADPDDEGSRRAALAEWIVDRQNPLTWRSIVNRVWHYHFGHGLVETTNDFGHMGALPSNPELLDWLASEFRDGGDSIKTAQSIKSLQRLIVTSATYRQSSDGDAAREKIDAGNRLLWRMNRRRLEAEALRDTVLSVSGKLDLTMGGPGYYLFGFIDDHSPHYLYDQHDPDDPKSLRRTIYRFIVRSVPDPFMTTLDCPDPSIINDKRFETVTALQSLAMLNDTFMVREAHHFADRLQQIAPDLPRQIDAAYKLALGRSPITAESRDLTNFAQKNGLPNCCRLIFNLNEFVFVD